MFGWFKDEKMELLDKILDKIPEGIVPEGYYHYIKCIFRVDDFTIEVGGSTVWIKNKAIPYISAELAGEQYIKRIRRRLKHAYDIRANNRKDNRNVEQAKLVKKLKELL